MTRTCILFALFLLLLLPRAHAQEVQVPLDEDARLNVMTAELATRLGLFSDVDNFREARLFRQGDDAYVLVVQHVENGSIVQERTPMTDAEVAVLRQDVSRAMATANLRPDLDQEGRVSVLWTSTIASLIAYGPSIVAVLDLEDETPAGTIVLLTGAAGFIGPYFATQNIPISESAAALTRTGTIMGYVHGAAVAGLAGGDGTSGRAVAGAGMALSIAEAIAAYRFATASRLERGAGEVMSMGSAFGAGYGIGATALLFGDDVDEDDTAIRLVSGLGLAGSAIGAWAGHRLTRSQRYTRGDARILYLTGLLGLDIGSAALIAADVDRARPIAGILMAGTTAGLIAGHQLTTGRDFSTSQGNFIALSTIAGGFIGGALSNIVGASNATAAVIGSAASVAGFGIMYAGFRGDAREGGNGNLSMSVGPTWDPADRSLRSGFHVRARF